MYKLHFSEILFIEGLKDYVVICLDNQKVITLMNIKTIHELLPKTFFSGLANLMLLTLKKSIL